MADGNALIIISEPKFVAAIMTKILHEVFKNPKLNEAIFVLLKDHDLAKRALENLAFCKRAYSNGRRALGQS